MKPTLADVIARSATKWKSKGGTDLSTYCGDCSMGMALTGWPCPKHATPEEREAVAKEIAAANLRSHPLLQMIKRPT